MTIERIPITDRAQWLALRQRDVTASAAAGLLGTSKYMTPLRLFALKTGQIEEDITETKITDRSIIIPPMGRGLRAEGPGEDLLRQLRPNWTITRNTDYFRDPDLRVGATPDLLVYDPELGPGIIQQKSVAPIMFDKEWKSDGEIEAPLEYHIQTIHEMQVVGVQWAAITAHVVGFDEALYLVDVTPHPAIWNRIKREVADFWRRVAMNNPPDPDFNMDGTLIASLYADADDDLGIDLGDNPRVFELLDEREKLKMRETDGDRASKLRKPIDAELIHILGNASTGRLADGRIITAKTTRRAGYTVQPTSFRTVRIKEPK